MIYLWTVAVFYGDHVYHGISRQITADHGRSAVPRHNGVACVQGPNVSLVLLVEWITLGAFGGELHITVYP